MTLRLSDAFQEVPGRKAEPCLELVATVVNINYGNNKELLAKCRELEEYAFFIHLLRGYVAEGQSFPVATRMAVDECIERHILHEILSKNRAEVYNMMLYEYDEAKHFESLRREGERRGEARSDQKWQGIVAELEADNRRLREDLAIAQGVNA